MTLLTSALNLIMVELFTLILKTISVYTLASPENLKSGKTCINTGHLLKESSNAKRRISGSLLSELGLKRDLFYALLTAITVHIDTWFRQDNQKKEAA